MGGRRAVFRPRGADLGCLAACFAGAARRRGGAADLKPCKRFLWLLPIWPRLRARRCFLACCGGLGCRTVPTPSQPQLRRVNAFLAAVLITTAARANSRQNCRPHLGRAEWSARNEQYSAPARLSHVRNRFATTAYARGQHRAANKTAQASAPPTTKVRAGPAVGQSSTDGGGSTFLDVATVSCHFWAGQRAKRYTARPRGGRYEALEAAPAAR